MNESSSNKGRFRTSPVISAEQIEKRVREIGKELTVIAQSEPVVAICVLKGAFMFFSDLVRAIDADITTEYVGLSSYGHSSISSGEVKMTLDCASSVAGKTVLIVEDIVDTGLTLNFLKKVLATRSPSRVMTASLLYKPRTARGTERPDFVGFEIGDDFVVGYGLDYQDRFRELPYIARIENFN